MLILIGYIHIDPAAVDAFLADVRAITPVARAEPGCLFYTVNVDDAPAGRMLVVERWRDQALLTAHLEAPATLAFLDKWASRMRGDVLKYDAANERPLVA